MQELKFLVTFEVNFNKELTDEQINDFVLKSIGYNLKRISVFTDPKINNNKTLISLSVKTVEYIKNILINEKVFS